MGVCDGLHTSLAKNARGVTFSRRWPATASGRLQPPPRNGCSRTLRGYRLHRIRRLEAVGVQRSDRSTTTSLNWTTGTMSV